MRTIVVLAFLFQTYAGHAMDHLTLANIGRTYVAIEGVHDYDSDENHAPLHYPVLICTPIDDGSDPLWTRVAVRMTFYWVPHKSAQSVVSAGIGTINKSGALVFEFIDEDGKVGSGTFDRVEDNFALTLKCADAKRDSPEARSRRSKEYLDRDTRNATLRAQRLYNAKYAFRVK